MPANRAVAYGDDISYQIVEVVDVSEGSLCEKGDVLVIADDLADDVVAAIGVKERALRANLMGHEMAGTITAHPMAGHGYDYEVPLLAGSHVTTDQGTGFVHIAPGHGVEDYELAHLKHGIAVPDTVSENGEILPHLPLFGGMHVLRDNAKIANLMASHRGVIGIGKLVHSYPHSWRSKAPVIYRNTAQWFVSMESHGLRNIALGELEKTTFYPAAGQKRLASMIEQRPDWCLSRPRAWGVPLTIFVNKETGEPLRDPSVHARIVDAMKSEGADCWFASDASRFLGANYNADDFEKITDILDVWFDSGSTHAFVMEGRDDLSSPADLYLEGSDQHRGWFHSSLLQSCATRQRAPYKAVLTHGFVLDEQGRKMSKSLGNVVTPQKVMEQNGADILRLWVVSSDYYNDLRIGPEIIKRTTDNYRRFRNTLRYLLGALDGFEMLEKFDYAAMPDLEKWILHRLASIDVGLREMTESYDFHGIFSELHQFCNSDLSAFYFEIRKDTLYCDDLKSTARLACLNVMNEVFNRLTAWLAPILCFTAEEAWQSRHADIWNSVHLRSYDQIPSEWYNSDVAQKWTQIRRVRQVVMSALETARNEGKIGSSLQAAPMVYISDDTLLAFEGQDVASLFITSAANLTASVAPDEAFQLEGINDVAVDFAMAEGKKCARCWKISPEVSDERDVCKRCYEVVSVLS